MASSVCAALAVGQHQIAPGSRAKSAHQSCVTGLTRKPSGTSGNDRTLRRKLGPGAAAVETVRGLGYRLNPERLRAAAPLGQNCVSAVRVYASNGTGKPPPRCSPPGRRSPTPPASNFSMRT